MPESRKAGMATMTPITAPHPGRGQQGEGVPPGSQMPHHRGADAGEGHLAQRQAAGVPDDGDDREPDNGQPPTCD